MLKFDRSGLSVGDGARVGESNKLVWVATGQNGENLIQAEGWTPERLWREACHQAVAVAMLGERR